MPLNHSETPRKKGAVRGRESRDQSLNTKLTKTEYAVVEAASQADGRAIGEWAREIVLKAARSSSGALGADPPVLLMDEPFGAIDPVTRHRLQTEFLNLQQRVRKTVVFVTHDLEEAIRLGDRIALLSEGGHLEQYATPGEVLGAPATPFVADFVGSDRSLRRLAVVPIKSGDALPMRPGDAAAALVAGPRVAVGASLNDALVAILDAPHGVVALVDGDDLVGVLTPESIYTASRRSLAPHESS